MFGLFKRLPADEGKPADEDKTAVEAAWKIHSAIVEWTGKVDTKASFALALESAAIAAIVSLTADGRRLSSLSGVWPRALFWIGLCSLMFAALTAASVVAPRLRSAATKADWRENFIYFGHIRHWNSDDLARALKERNILPVLSRQLVNMSQVAWRKHRRVQVSLMLGVCGAALAFAAGIVS